MSVTKQDLLSRVLGIDPGITTGICFIQNKELIFTTTINIKGLSHEDNLLGLMRMTQPTLVVIERPPPAARYNVQVHQDLFAYLVQWFTGAGIRVQVISPGSWKNHIARTKIDCTHVRDAADMTYWTINHLAAGKL